MYTLEQLETKVLLLAWSLGICEDLELRKERGKIVLWAEHSPLYWFSETESSKYEYSEELLSEVLEPLKQGVARVPAAVLEFSSLLVPWIRDMYVVGEELHILTSTLSMVAVPLEKELTVDYFMDLVFYDIMPWVEINDPLALSNYLTPN